MDRHSDIRGLFSNPQEYFQKALESVDFKGGITAVSDGIAERNKNSAVAQETDRQISLSEGQVPTRRASATAAKTKGTVSVDPIRFEREWFVRMQKFSEGN